VASTVRAEPRPQEKSKPVVVERKAEDKELAPITAQQLAEDIHTKIPLAMTEEEVEATASQFGALQLVKRRGHVDEDREVEVHRDPWNVMPGKILQSVYSLIGADDDLRPGDSRR
jgi:hypothetical protein